MVVARIWGGLTFQQIGQLVGISDSAGPSALRSGAFGLAAEIEGVMSQKRLNDELAAIEAALCSLTPAASGIDRDRLMFLAGRASARHHGRKILWPTATAASLLLAVTFGILWTNGSGPRLVRHFGEPIAVAPADDLRRDALPPSPWENRRLCQLMLEKGIDALPQSQPWPVRHDGVIRPAPRDDSYRGLLNEFLNTPTS